MNPIIKLRALEPEDLDLLYRIENDHELWEVGISNVPYSRYVLRDYIAHAQGDIYQDQQVRLIIENDEGRVVGVADIVNFDAKNLRAEVGIVILKEFRRKGYAKATLKELGSYALRTLHLHQLYVYVDGNNETSIQLFKNCGYQICATLHDWLYDGLKYHDAVLMQRFF